MKKLILILLLFAVSNQKTFSQHSTEPSLGNDLENNYLDYFKLTNETIFTHLNKSVFFKNEELWFKTYIYNTKEQKPYVSTTNVYASIYDENGKLLIKKLYFAKAGSSKGNFKLDSLFSPGIYFLKTDTNWMKNFNEDNSNIQKFEIVDLSKKNNSSIISENSYDFQFLPEGGHLIDDTTNNIGFKFIDSNGKSVPYFSGKIFDDQNNLITTFKGNNFGLGKFEIKIEKGRKYHSIITLDNDITIKNDLPKAEPNGVTLNIIGKTNSKLAIVIRTNNNTLNFIANKSYNLLIHRDGLAKKMPINFVKDKYEYLLMLSEEVLLSGVNTITLFNNLNQPIAERIIYNNTNSPAKSVFISKIIKEVDSTVIQLSTNINNLTEKSLSISILPSSTKAYTNNSTITAAFLLNPYIKGQIENPNYYFSNTDKKTLYDLDLLLLTQGWNRYSWNNIFYHPPQLNYSFETGFNITGSLNNYRNKNTSRLILSSKENFIHSNTNLDNKYQFNFENLFLADKSNIKFSLEKKNGDQFKPYVNFNVYPKKFIDSIKTNNKNTTSILNDYEEKETNDTLNENLFLSDSIVVLDLVKLNSIKKKEKAQNNPILSTFGSKYISFSDSNNPNSLITDYIRNSGFNVNNEGFNVKITSRRYANFEGSRSPTVFLDNIPLDDLDPLVNLRVFEVEEMYISTNNSTIYASSGGVIQIFTKKGKFNAGYKVFNNFKVDFGFSIPKEYYNPKYDMSNINMFSDYGVINWEPNVELDDNGELNFKIPNSYNDNINLYIEGMAEDGSLFSKIESIRI